MGSASFVQQSFSAGEWSADAQGRFSDPDYKSGLNVCLNAFPTERGSWTRRPGFRYLAHTKAGAEGILRAFDFSITQPYQMEFTDSFVRFFAGLALVTCADGDVYVDNISTASPARVYLGTPIPSHWAAGNTVV